MSLERYQRIGEELDKKDTDKVEILSLAEAAEKQAQDTSNVISSGFDDIDNCTEGGFREGDFTIITGIPGEGKTTLARMFTLNMGQKDMPSIWFSHEMSNRELWDSFEKMGAQRDLISYVPLELNDDIDWMLKVIDEAIEQKNIKAVFIDTLGDIIRSVKSQQEMSNYATYLAQICKDLRRYAVKRNIAIFAIAHAVKNTRSKSNETDNADIANSNGIPAAATNIFHIWRDLNEDNLSYVKIGKSRRDGSKKGWILKYRFVNNKLIPEGRYVMDDESTW